MKQSQGATRLAALQMADHVPGHVVGQGGYLFLGLFHPVFAHLAHAQFVGLLQRVDWAPFGHSDQGHLARLAPGSLRGGGDAGLNRGEIILQGAHSSAPVDSPKPGNPGGLSES